MVQRVQVISTSHTCTRKRIQLAKWPDQSESTENWSGNLCLEAVSYSVG